MSMASASAPAPAPFPAWLRSPEITVIQVEVLVVSAAVLLFFQLIFGFCRRQSSNKLIQGGLWFAYTVSFPVVAYTLGVMQSSPVKSQMYPVWAISLFLVAGCTNSITVYDLDDNKQWKKQLVELFQHYFYASLIFLLLYPTQLSFLNELMLPPAPKIQPIFETCYGLLAIVMYSNLLRVIACWMATFPEPSKAVADYMRGQADESTREAQLLQGGYDPVTMRGYRYLVRWCGYSLSTHGARVANYRNKLAEDDAITIDMIWESCGGGGKPSSDEGSETRDVCLSFALFHLLKRRFFGISCCEADLPETRDFVLRGLLSSSSSDQSDHGVDGGSVARAFRVIEVELGFLHDFFFTKYAAIYENELVFFLIFVAKIMLTVTLGVFVYKNSLVIKTSSPIIAVYPRSRDTMITLAILGALVMVDVLQAMLYLASDWALVSVACSQVIEDGRSCCQALCSVLRKLIWMLRRRRLARYWQNKIGQYSVIEGCRWHRAPSPPEEPRRRKKKANVLLVFIVSRLQVVLREVIWKVWTGQYCGGGVARLKRLPESVKRAVASTLIRSPATAGGNGCRLTSGEASLRRNSVLGRFEWTLNREVWSATDTMLIWHVATGYCELALPDAAEDSEDHHREVAAVLSRYAAYLMAFVPELLPGSPVDTEFTFDKVMEEAAEALYPSGDEEQDDTEQQQRAVAAVDRETLVERLRSEQGSNGGGTIFSRGVELGRELEGDDVVRRWKVMAEFWAEAILYVAPSNNVRGHVEQLANGGEFLTHVWALLSHAGILARGRQQQQQVDHTA